MATCLALLTAPQASAESVPAPTVAVSVKAAGQSLPKNTTTATWVVGKPGHNAQLNIDAYNAPGVVTVVDALWTSREFRVYPKIPAFEFELTTTHSGSPTSSMPASVAYGLRYREAGRPWSAWFDQSQAYVAGVPLQGLFRDPKITFGTTPKRKVQFQFRVHSEIEDVSRETQTWKLLANI